MIKLLAIILLITFLVSGCASSIPVAPTQPTPAPTQPSPPPPVATPAPAPTVPQGNQIGNLAIDFQLKNLEGKTVSLSGLRGKPVLLNFWATWCPPCRSEMPYLQQIYNSYSAQGLELLEIDVGESASPVKQFLASNNLTLPVLLDTDKKVALAYGTAAIPTSLLIDKNGIIKQRIIGAFNNKAEIEQELSRIFP
jgi:peroxiredoxin